MNRSGQYVEAQPDISGRRSRKKTVKKKNSLAVTVKSGEPLLYDQFRKRYGLQQVNDPIVSDTIDAYVRRNNLREKNWAELCSAFDLLVGYLGNENSILRRLIYSICHKFLQERSYGGRRSVPKVTKGPRLRKITVKEENRKRREYISSLKIVIDHLWEIAPFLAPYHGDEHNPLSGSRLREMLGHLKALERAESEIERLRKEDRGRRARYIHDPVSGHYVRMGTTISDPITVMLIYVWKAKEERTGSTLSKADYEAIASIMEFWNFLPSILESERAGEVTLLKDRIKRYKKMNIRFHPSGWGQEYHPMVYVE